MPQTPNEDIVTARHEHRTPVKANCSLASVLYLSSLGMCDASVQKVALLPFGVEAAALELPELEGGVKRSGLNFNRDGVDDHRHPLHNLLSEAVLTAETDRKHTSDRVINTVLLSVAETKTFQ